jgi:hypothetical protein
MDDFLDLILKTALDNNVQLFAATHNIELLQHLKNVLETDERKDLQEKVRHFEIIEHTKDSKMKRSFAKHLESSIRNRWVITHHW